VFELDGTRISECAAENDRENQEVLAVTIRLLGSAKTIVDELEFVPCSRFTLGDDARFLRRRQNDDDDISG